MRLSKKENPNLPAGQEKVVTEGAKVNVQSISQLLLKTVRKLKQFLKKKSQKKLSTKLLKLELLSLMSATKKELPLLQMPNHVLSSRTKKFRLQLSLVKLMPYLREKLVS